MSKSKKPFDRPWKYRRRNRAEVYASPKTSQSQSSDPDLQKSDSPLGSDAPDDKTSKKSQVESNKNGSTIVEEAKL
ncbi:hypothetical protein RRG08_013919 [Elysia crispata]|uniref:Uncharacterized protein n=1 Tax=Elysia crispata TaxID=231223 RepID=A0AAE1B015_9GAST|nr:hypothetical protein RRG08_013919 [Elysia crispata]